MDAFSWFSRHLELAGFNERDHGLQTVKELVDNAVDAVRGVEGGEVHVRVRDVRAALRLAGSSAVPREFSAMLEANVPLVEVSVQDNGRGFAEDRIAYLAGTLFGSSKADGGAGGEEDAGRYGVGLKLVLLSAHMRLEQRRFAAKCADPREWPRATMCVESGCRKVTMVVEGDGVGVEEEEKDEEEGKRGALVRVLVPESHERMVSVVHEVIAAHTLAESPTPIHSTFLPSLPLTPLTLPPPNTTTTHSQTLLFPDGSRVNLDVTIHASFSPLPPPPTPSHLTPTAIPISLFRTLNSSPLPAKGDWLSGAVCSTILAPPSSSVLLGRKRRLPTSTPPPLFPWESFNLSPPHFPTTPHPSPFHWFIGKLHTTPLHPTSLTSLRFFFTFTAPTLSTSTAFRSLAKTSLRPSPPLHHAIHTCLQAAFLSLKRAHPTNFLSPEERKHEAAFHSYIPATVQRVASIIRASRRPHVALFAQRLLGLDDTTLEGLEQELHDRILLLLHKEEKGAAGRKL